MPLCDFATIDSDHEVVLHIGNLASSMRNFGELAGILGCPIGDLMGALMLPNNDDFALALYRGLHKFYDGKIPGKPIGEDPSTVPPTLRRGPAISMPPEDLHDARIARITLFTLHDHGESFEGWELPPRDFWAPRTPTILYQLDRLVGRGPSRKRCVEVAPAEFPSAVVNDLFLHVAELEKQVEALAIERGKWAEHRLSLEYARRVAVLCEWQWDNLPEKVDLRIDALEGIRKMIGAIESLDRGVEKAAPAFVAERLAARAVLELISPVSSAAPQIREALEIVATQPTAFSSEQTNDLLSVLERAFVALSASSLAESFVTEHLISLFQSIVENLSPQLASQLDDVEGARWQSLWDVDWQEALGALRAPGGVDDSSPLAPLAAIGKHYKTGLSIIQAGLNDGTLPLLLARLSSAARSPGHFQQLAHSLASCMIRGLLASGVLHRGAPGKVLFAGKDVTSWFKACARALNSGTDVDIAAVGTELRELKLGTALKETRLLASVSFVFSAVSTLVACGDTWDRSWQSWARVIAETLKTGDALTRVAYSFKVQTELQKGVISLGDVGSALGTIASIIGFVATVGDAYENWEYMQRKYKIAASLSIASAAGGVMRLIPMVASSARFMKGLTIAGFVLAAVSFAIDIHNDMTKADTRKIFEKYLGFAMSGAIYQSTVVASEFEAVFDASKETAKSGAFCKLRGDAGERGVIPHQGYPTWHFANSLGFPAELVAPMFDRDLTDVVKKGIPLSPDYKGKA